MKKFSFSLIIFCLFQYPSAYAENNTEDNEDKGIKILSASESALVLELEVNDFCKQEVVIGGETFYVVTAPNMFQMLQEGKPDIPSITQSIAIPSTSACNIRVLETQFEDMNIQVAPSKGSILRPVDPSTIPYTFSSVYEEDAFYPSELVTTGTPFLMRDVRGCVIRFNPFQYNPYTRTLRVYRKIRVEVSFSGNDYRNSAPDKRHTCGKAFETMFKNLFINYDQIQALITRRPVTRKSVNRSQISERNEKMLIICCDSFAMEMRNFVIHKNNLGLPTTLTKISEVGTTASEIASYIQNTYDADSALTFVLLVGDDDRIPTKMCSHGNQIGGSDPSYALVKGNDYIPDIFIGRFSARTRSEVQTMVERTINYENNEEKIWHHRGIGIASNQGSPPDYQYIRQIRNRLLSYHYNDVAEIYDGSQGGSDAPGEKATIMQVSNAVNQGASIINYLGHGSTNAWGTSGYNVNSIDSLQNDNKLPFVFSVACLVGNFTGQTTPCFAEKWLTAQNGMNGNPTGAIAFYGSSVNQPWEEPIGAINKFNDMLVYENDSIFGAMCYSSSIKMMEQYGSYINYVFLTWNIFGDPSLSLIPNNNIGQTIFVEDMITDDSIYCKKYIDVHNAVINANVELNHDSSTRITGPFRTINGSKLLIH